MGKLINFLKKKFGFTDRIVGVIEEDGLIEPIDENMLAILNEVVKIGHDVEGHVDAKGKLHIKHHPRKKK